MANLFHVLLIIALIIPQIYAPESDCSTDEYPVDIINDEDPIDRFCTGEDRIDPLVERDFVSRLVDGPLTRPQILKIANRIVELLKRPRVSSVNCRINAAVNLAAQRLIQFMTQDTFESSTDDDMPPTPKRKETIDEEWCDLYSIPIKRRKISLSTQQYILNMHANNESTKSIRSKYHWYYPKYLAKFKRCVEAGGERATKMGQINDYVVEMFTDARNRLLVVHNYDLETWAIQKSTELLMNDFFKASKTWVYNFKKRYGIVSRKITEYSSRTEKENAEQIAASIASFRQEFSDREFYFPRRLIWNADHVGFQYEIVQQRTLSWRGERDTIVNVDSKNKVSHSYTTFPLISRSGSAIGKLLLILQERNGEFGPVINPKVRQLERSLGNVRCYASSNGKMLKEQMYDWVDEVLRPAKNAHMNPEDGATEILDDYVGSLLADDEAVPDSSSKFDLMLLLDSWSGQTNDYLKEKLNTIGVGIQMIPPGTTSEIQPLDVNFNRQYKKFVKRIVQRATYENLTKAITSREGIIKMHSFVWDQFSSPKYNDMIRYAWHNTDPGFVREELSSGPPPAMVSDIQFSFDRSALCDFNCTKRAFVKCAHDGKLSCLSHFMQGKCSRDHGESISRYESSPSMKEPFGSPPIYLTADM